MVVLIALAVFVGMGACLEFGFRIGRKAASTDPQFHAGLGAIEGAIFALLGLLLAFAFAEAMSRFEARRQLIIQEASAINTAYLRLDLLTPAEQQPVRRLFRDYLDSRIRAYEGADLEATLRLRQDAAQLQQQIWTAISAVARADETRVVAQVVVPAVNEMIGVTTARTVALETRLPTLILDLLIATAVLSALVAGYAMAQRPTRNVLHMVLYATVVSMTLYTVMDLGTPRIGLIRLDATERILNELKQSIR